MLMIDLNPKKEYPCLAASGETRNKFQIRITVWSKRDFRFHASDFYDYHYIKKIIFSRFALVEGAEVPLVLICPLNLKHQ